MKLLKSKKSKESQKLQKSQKSQKSLARTSSLVLACTLTFTLCSCGSSTSTIDQSGDYSADIQYNFAEQAQTFMEKIGTDFTNRCMIDAGDSDMENTHDACEQWIVSELKAAGYTDDQIVEDSFEVDPDDIEYSDVDLSGIDSITATNVVLTVEGKNPDEQIIVGAHYDGDGVGDNGSGIALLLANACGLYGVQPDVTVKYIFFDGEEDGEFGSYHVVENMTKQEKKNTLYMINIDSIAFGDYCNVYGGVEKKSGTVTQTDAYDLAMTRAAQLGMNTYTTDDLNGYYAANGSGPAIEENTLYSNPWTSENPAPENGDYTSPSTGDWGDHAAFTEAGITYLYMEATNWYAAGDGGYDAYTGYFDTGDPSLGDYGMFMNTEYDTLENLEEYFPGRALAHFNVFSPLLASLCLHP